MRFGLGIPTGGEGLMYPVPFADASGVVDLALEAEELGFDSVWANDHIVTQSYVAEQFSQPPRYYDPLMMLSNIAARTSHIRLATCIVVMAFRHPAVLAKAVSTLDHLSGGRAVLGLGVGAYREEIEALWPDQKLHRGEHAEETLQALQLLFTERSATFRGRWVNLEGIEAYPKPIQEPIRMICGGNAAASRHRAARYATGWMPASQRPEDIVEGLAEIHAEAERVGRVLPDDFEVAPQMGVAIGDTYEEAWNVFERSQLYVHKKSLAHSTLKNQQGDVEKRNLIGTADQIAERVQEYRDAGVNTMAGLLFSANDPSEMKDQMAAFSAGVIAQFNGNGASFK